MEKRQLFHWSWNYKRNCLNKNIKKENVLKDLLNLVETYRQINMTSDYSVSSNNSFKSHFNAKNFNMFFNIMAVVQSTVILLQCLLQGWSEHISVMWLQLQKKTEKNPHHQQYQQKHHLMTIVMKILLMQTNFVGNNRK